jgi:hypothetical protein
MSYTKEEHFTETLYVRCKLCLHLNNNTDCNKGSNFIMRCTGCGLPLSPQRTHCPRCGKAAGEPEEKNNKQAETPQYAFPSFQENNNPTDIEAFQAQPAGIAQQQLYNEIPGQVFHSAGTEQFPGQPNQMALPDPGQTLQANPAQKSDWQSFPQPKPGNAPSDGIKAGEFRPSPQRPEPIHSRRTVQPGFTVAGLCVLSGGLILMLVYIISLNLPLLATGTPSATIANTPTSQTLSPGAQMAATTTPLSPTAIPTPSLPGKMYIDNAQMGSSLVLNTAQLSQITTTFTVNQKIFVTFIVHPLNAGGAVCLNWYVNQKQFSQFSFAVGVGLQHAYSFAFAGSAGSGSVSISWASSTDCTDKMLAQVVTFTVTP